MRNKRYPRGFTIVEMLIALAITAILLTAIAVAFNASIINFNENQKIFKAINSARQALSRITTEVRTGFVDQNNISDQTRCEVLCADGSTVPYHTYYLVPYVDDNGQQKNKLKLHVSSIRNDVTNPLTDPLLCDNVAAMTFKKDNGTPTGDVKSVQISMTLVSGDVQQTLAAAAVVRRVLN
jgi:prepilin-type N-terminal cleavage/methylation domain-containing protein